MALLALIIGAVLIVSAIRNTHGELMAAVRQDVPAFAIWGAAIFGVALIGFIPGLKPVSRGLLALLVVVIVLANYRNIIGAFQGVAYGAPAQAAGGVSDATFAGVTGGGDTAFLDKISALVGQIGSGQSGDYTDIFGGSGAAPSASSSSTPTAIPYDDADDYAGDKRGSMAAMVVKPGIVETVVSAVASVFQGNPDPYGIPAEPNAAGLYTAGSAQWQKDTFASEAAALAAKVAAGGVDQSSPEYQSKLAYLANLTGGVATADQEMAKLKAMGL
jgi:hypothetical protein